MSPTSLALSNLRAFVILIVLGFHSVLAYLDLLPLKQSRFDAPPYDWQSFPLIDSQRFFGFDLFCAWHDVYLMSLMFFISGLFVWPSLARKGSGTFLRDRLLRLGLPLVLAVYVLMPIALYPSYRVPATDPSVAEYWRQLLALPFWPCGPQWFLWQLLGLNLCRRRTAQDRSARRRGVRDMRRLGGGASWPLRPRAAGGLGGGLRAARVNLFALELVSLRAVSISRNAGRCITPSTSSLGWCSARMASIAACWRPTESWRVAGTSRSQARSRDSCSGSCLPR